MDKECQQKCKDLIRKHRGYKSEHWKTKTRNEVFLLIEKDLRIWIVSISKSWNKAIFKEDVISLSWDIFLFCLKHYKDDAQVIPHFYNYCKYYLLNKFASEDKVHIHLDELKETVEYVSFWGDAQLERLITLFQFREVLPEEHRVVWDDAAMSLNLAPRERHITYSHGLTQNSYFNLKRSFKEIIKLILNQKNKT